MSNKKKVTSKVTGVVAGATVGTLVALTAGVPAFAAPGDPVNFDDQNFKNCIADELGVDRSSTITEGQMATLTSVYCDFYDPTITDITGAEFLTSATYLGLYGADITDLTPVAGLTQLTNLDISYSANVTDLTPVWGLTNLQSLTIDNTGVTSLAGAENLDKLAYLSINRTTINDLTPVADAPLVSFVAQDAAELTDITPLAGKTGIQYLNLQGTKIDDLSTVATLTGVTSLNLGRMLSLPDDADLASLTPLTGLEFLTLTNSNITDITPVASFENLIGLYVDNSGTTDNFPVQGNKITDITPVAELNNLRALGLGGNNIKDVSAVSGLTGLEYLDLGYNEITNLTPLAGLTNVESLRVEGQRLFYPDVTATNTPVRFEVTAVDGSSVAPTIDPATAGTYNPTTREITYTEGGTVEFNWSVPVVVGTANANFTGFGAQVVGSVPAATTIQNAVPGTATGTVDVSWAPVTDTGGNGTVASYLVQYRLVGATNWEDGDNVTATNATIRNLTAGSTYEFRVAAIASNNVLGAFSAPATAMAASDASAAPAVTGVKVNNLTGSSADVTWDAVVDTNGNGDVTTYTVSYGTGNSGDAFEVPGSENSARLVLSPGTTYSLVVSYTTSTGATGTSAPVTFTAPNATEAPAITGLTATEGETKGSVNLEWVAVNSTADGTGGNGEVTSYTIRYRAVGAPEWITVGTYEGNGDVNSGTVINLANGAYEFTVTYTTDTGVTSPIAFATASVTNGLANGANGTDGTPGNTNGGTDTPDATVTNSDIAATGAPVDNTALMVGIALTVVGGIGLVATNGLLRRKETLV